MSAAGLDCDAFPLWSTYGTNSYSETQTVVHGPSNALSAITIYTLPGNANASTNYKVQLGTCRSNKRWWSRWQDGPSTWTAWEPLATATPPTWHNAPLEQGWSWISQGKYGKDGAGKAYLLGAVRKASAPLSSEAILRLPADYRPPVTWPVSLIGGCGGDGKAWGTYGYLHTDGYLKFNGGALPANYSLNQGIAFSTVFPCAT